MENGRTETVQTRFERLSARRYWLLAKGCLRNTFIFTYSSYSLELVLVVAPKLFSKLGAKAGFGLGV